MAEGIAHTFRELDAKAPAFHRPSQTNPEGRVIIDNEQRSAARILIIVHLTPFFRCG
jgi:hypothetical protein